MSKCKVVVKFTHRVKLINQTALPRLNGLRWIATISADHKAYFDDASLAAAKPFKDMPSLFMLPYFGTAWIYLPIIGRYELSRFVDACHDKHRRLGSIFREKVGPMNVVFTANADDMKVLTEHEGPYPFRGELDTMRVYRESRKQWYSTTGITILKGKDWLDLRRKTQKHLMKPKAIQSFLNPMQDVARDLVANIHKIRDSNKEVSDFLGELYKWSLESIALVGLDTRMGCLKTDLPPDSDGLRMIRSVQTQFECVLKLEPFFGNVPFWKLFPTPTWKKFTAASDVFAEMAFKHIKRALENIKKSTDEDKDLTLLQSMLATKDLDVSGALVTVADMLMAGIDSTSHTVGYLLFRMAKNPDKQELLYQDIKRLLPEKGDRITPAIFNELKYLKACMKESQRMDPIIAGMARSLDHDVILSGYKVPAGTMVFVVHQKILRDPEYFSNPDEYLPERWLQKEEKFNPYSFLPFGVGTRSCIGRRLAELEIICAVTEILKNFRVEYHYEDFGIITRIVNTPDKPLRFKFIER